MKKGIVILLVLVISVALCLIVLCVNNTTGCIEKHPVNSHEYVSEVEGSIIAKLTQIVRSEAYVVADNNEKDLLVLEVLYEIADKGTDKYPYSLIDKDSIRVEYTPQHIVYYTLLDGQECYFVL